MTDEEYTKDLARRIRGTLVDLFGIEHELTEDLLEHVLCEALFQAAHDVANGRIVRLESLGEIACLSGEPAFRADDGLRQLISRNLEETNA